MEAREAQKTEGLENPKRSSVVVRDANGRLQKGSANLNPGGRPKGLALQIREATGGGTRLVEIMQDIAEGKIRGTARDRIEAIRWLADRGYGRTPETLLTGQLGEEQREAALELTREQLLGLIDAAPPPALPEAGQAPQLAAGAVEDAEIIEPTD